MACGICHQEIEGTTYLLPMRQQYGYFVIDSCLECAKTTEVFCIEHEVGHEVWGSLTRCRKCAAKLTEENMYRIGTLIGLVEEAANDDFQVLKEEKCMDFLTEGQKDCIILFFFASSALAMKMDLDELVHRVVSAGSLEIMKI
jgi:hypothetical protein